MFFFAENTLSSKKIDEVDFNMYPIPLHVTIPLYITSNKEEHVLQITEHKFTNFI